MPTFDFPALVWWGLPLAVAPVAIHLLSRLRHSRVAFAPLEFLVASRRRHRVEVLLRQLLLLALRTAAVLALALALARPQGWGRGGPFAARSTFHVVLIDDSFSMGDLSGPAGTAPESAFDRGRRAAERIAADLAALETAHELSLVRSSRLLDPPRVDLPRRAVDARTLPEVRGVLAEFAVTARDTPPAAALTAAADLVVSGSAGAGVLWLVSDFRARDWLSAGEAAAALERMVAAGFTVHFVDCAAEAAGPGNLTLERLEPVRGVPAIGGTVVFEVQVRNDGPLPAANVPVAIREDGLERPGISLAAIPPGGVATGRFDVRFAAPGGHAVEAALPGDVLPADDSRTAVLEIADAVDVLLVDGDPRGGSRAGDAFYVAAALAPGGAAPTGLRPRIEPARRLADLDLDAFDSVWLLDVERLDRPELAALEAYARRGGGVVFFGGPRTDVASWNRLAWRDGAGLLPAPLAGAVDLADAPDAAAAQPDLCVDDHPVVAVLSGQRNPLLDAVSVDRYLAVDRDARATGLRRLVSLRNGAPLIVERAVGAGVAVAVLTTAAPAWNNWARGNPSWVVVMLELEGHLARGRRRAAPLTVGDPLVVQLDAVADGREVEFVVPPDGTVVRRAASQSADGVVEARLTATELPGRYLARWPRLDGGSRERLAAVGVAPTEGRLERIGRERLARGLAGIPFAIDRADELAAADDARTGGASDRPLLLALVALLLVEQVAAYRAGYHAPRSPRGRPAA